MTPAADWKDRVASLMETFCTKEEVAAAMGVTSSRLDGMVREAFSEEFEDPTYIKVQERHYAIGRARLHRAQFDAALEGDRSMLLALGKEYLGQGEDVSATAKEDVKEGTVLALVQGQYADAPDRKSRAAH